jgi:hypothetical protein
MTIRKDITKAIELYSSFREKKPNRIAKVGVTIPRVAAAIGYVEQLGYVTDHNGETVHYTHDFAPGSRPIFAVSANGRTLLLLGGRFQFTEQGIVDKDARGRLITNPQHGKSVSNPKKRRAPHESQYVRQWYDRRSRYWIVQGLDESGDQVDSADYSGTREDSDLDVKRRLEWLKEHPNFAGYHATY